MLVSFLAIPACVAEKSNRRTPNNHKTTKIIVVYYSQTGITEKVANIITKELNATSFALKPKIPYTDADLNWNNPNSQVCIEYNNVFLLFAHLCQLVLLANVTSIH